MSEGDKPVLCLVAKSSPLRARVGGLGRRTVPSRGMCVALSFVVWRAPRKLRYARIVVAQPSPHCAACRGLDLVEDGADRAIATAKMG